MQKTILLVLAMLALTGPAAAQDAARNMINAAAVEWYVDHCDVSKVNNLYVEWATKVVTDARPGEMDPYRERFRANIVKQFAGDTGKACNDIGNALAKAPADVLAHPGG